MGLTAARNFGGSLELPKEKGFLSFLDRPGNVTKSIIQAVKGEGDFVNILNSAIPFKDYKYIPASEITGSKSGIINFIAELALDPTTFLGGVGILTKSGKGLKAVKELQRIKQGLRVAGRVTKDITLLREAKEVGRMVRELEKSLGDTSGIQRAIVRINLPFQKGGIDLGDANKLAASLSSVLPKTIKKRLSRVKQKIDDIFKSEASTERVADATAIRERQVLRGQRVSDEQFQRDLEVLDIIDQRLGAVADERKLIRLSGLESADIVSGRGLKSGRELGGGLFRGTRPRSELKGLDTRKIPKNARGIKFVTPERSLAEQFAGDSGKVTEFGFRMDTKILREGDLLHNRIVEEGIKTGHVNPETGSNWAAFENQSATDQIREAGYDAVEMTQNSGTRTYMVLNPKKLRKAHSVQDELDFIVNAEIRGLKKTLDKELKADKITQFQFFNKFQEGLTDILRETELKRVPYEAALARWGKLVPQEQELLLKFSGEMESMISMEIGLGATDKAGHLITRLKSNKGFFGYVPRILSNTALSLKKSKRKVFIRATREFNKLFAASHKRRLFPEEVIDEVNTILRKPISEGGFGFDFDFYETNVIEIMKRRRVQHHEFLAKRQFADILTDGAVLEKAKSGDVSIKRVFKELNIHESQAGTGFIPASVFNDAKKQVRMLNLIRNKSDKGIHKLMQKMDHFNSYWRVSLTSFFPAKFTRDLLGNFWNMDLVDGFSPQMWGKAVSMYRKVANAGAKFDIEKVLGKDVDIWREMLDQGIIAQFGRAETADFMRTMGLRQNLDVVANRPLDGLKNIASRILGTPRVPEKNQLAFNRLWGRSYGKMIDNTSRMSMYMVMKDKGMSSFQARKIVNDLLFDYTKLTPVEQQFFRPSMLFYTWSRKNIPLVINTLITQPRIAAMYNHVLGGGRDDNLPDWMRGGQAFKFSENTFIQRIGLPFEDINIFNTDRADPTGTVFGDFLNRTERFSQNVLSNLGPALRIPAELVTGKDFYRGRDLNTMSLLKYTETISPASRIIRTLEKIFEDPLSGATIIDVMTGVRTYKVDKLTAEIETLRREGKRSGKFQRLNFPNITRKKGAFREGEPATAFELRLRGLEAQRKARR